KTLGADGRRPPKREPAALPGSARGSSADGGRLLPAGGGRDPPRAARPGAALFRRAWPGRQPCQYRLIGRQRREAVRDRAEPYPGGHHPRPGSTPGLDRVPSPSRGAAAGGARDLRLALLSRRLTNRGRLDPPRLGEDDQTPLAVGPAAAA